MHLQIKYLTKRTKEYYFMEIKKTDSLSNEELDSLVGGNFTAQSLDNSAVQMGNSSCCNVTIPTLPGKSTTK